jgi:hypothetical protein
VTYALHDGDVPPMRAALRGAWWLMGTASVSKLVASCRSRSGVSRRRHTKDKDGRCIFCDRKVAN